MPRPRSALIRSVMPGPPNCWRVLTYRRASLARWLRAAPRWVTAAAIRDDVGLGHVRVVLPATHDTASAVVAVPAAETAAERPNWCYISSGTWSLMGAEVPRPVINDKCLELNFTNEGGVGGTTRLLKNIAGLWLVQECRRVWNESGANHGWDDLNRLALAAPPLVSLVDPDDPSFLAPASMPEAIRHYCRRTGQTVPPDEGAVIRCALESLALRYRIVFGRLEQLVGGRIDTIHVVGGGTQNASYARPRPTPAIARCWPVRSRPRRSAICWSKRSRPETLVPSARRAKSCAAAFRSTAMSRKTRRAGPPLSIDSRNGRPSESVRAVASGLPCFSTRC